MTASAGNKPPTGKPLATAVGKQAAAVVESRSLFAGKNEVAISHAGETYRLRLTRQNKLILTK